MSYYRNIILIIAVLLCTVSALCYPSPDSTLIQPDSIAASLTVLSLGKPFDVYLDSVYAGTTPLTSKLISSGVHVLQYRYSEQNSWFSSARLETLTVVQGQLISRSLQLPVIFRVSSDPFGAEVWINDSLAGATPCMFSSLQQTLIAVVKKTGYAPTTVMLTPEKNIIHLILDPQNNEGAVSSSLLVTGNSTKDPLPIYASAAITIATGAAAAFFKVRADNRYADYQRTGNAGNLDDVHLYDRVSGVSLVISELSFAAFSYFLLSR